MKNIALGRYIPLNTPFHRLDPRAKILAMFITLIAVFFPAGFIGYGIIGAVVLGCIFAAGLKLDFLIKAMRPMVFMLVFLLVVNILVIKTGDILFNIGSFAVHIDAITQTLYITVRLALMIMITTLLTATTKPLDLTLGIEFLLTPFRKVGFPAHEIAMMISIALRFIPTLIEETDRIMKAQTSRGVDVEEGNLKEKIMAILSLIVPLFVSAFQKAEDLANAMEARGYNPSAKRTRYKVLKWRMSDSAIVVGSLVICVACGMVAFIL
ncbi:MAG: energy-coupling factor transporter transmembrane protein EcfT [Erysipelotrichaceae bacterium]|nr:energy-coupling factor transporter transmembrane protein EcfT [Erysipelotrichaceae bacterium]